MPPPEPHHSSRSTMLRSLLGHEVRVLWQNRMACAVIVLTLAVAGLMRYDRRHRDTSPGETCYVLYWHQDDWVRRLQAAAEDAAGDGLRIDVVPASQLTGSDGIIRYPPGTHSIQLRTGEPDRNGRRQGIVWFWYSGNDPGVLDPYAEWFWRVTVEHLTGSSGWEVRTSPMRPELVVLGKETHVGIDTLLNPARIDAALVWVLLFFTACHLPKLSLSQSIDGRMLFSLVVTPAGWRGVAAAIHLFYAALSVLLAGAAAAILRADAMLSMSFWMTIVLATAAYLGVAFVIASWCQSIASASVGTLVYLMLSGLILAVSTGLPEPLNESLRLYAFLEGVVASLLANVWEPESSAGGAALLASLAVWAGVWQLAGHWSYSG